MRIRTLLAGIALAASAAAVPVSTAILAEAEPAVSVSVDAAARTITFTWEITPEILRMPEASFSSRGCTVNWSSSASTAGISSTVIEPPWNWCKVNQRCVRVTDGAQKTVSSRYIGDWDSAFSNCATASYPSYMWDTAYVSISLAY